MISNNGICYEIRGSGDLAAIFLHYFGSSGETWSGIINRLTDQLQCIAPDLRGFGYSNESPEVLGVEDHADDIQCLIESLGLKKYVLVGHSMGGKIAIALAARNLPGLQSMVLLAPSPPTPEPMSDNSREELRQMFGKKDKIKAHLKKLAIQSLSEAIIAKETAIQMQADHTAWRAWLDTGSRQNIAGIAEKINIPTLIIGGAADNGITPNTLTEEVEAYINGSNTKVIADTGHLLHLEREMKLLLPFRNGLAGIRQRTHDRLTGTLQEALSIISTTFS